MKRFKQITIQTKPQNNDLVTGLLWQLEIDGITEDDNSLTVFVDSAKNISQKEIRPVLNEAVNNHFIDSYELTEEEFEDRNWNEEYEKNVRVIQVTEKIVIKPSFKEYERKGDELVIVIDPKMSFGTGEHETTKLILKFIEKYVKAGYSVLDVGSGTGVLAIASVMLGAEKALAIDNDEWCLLNGKENVKMNNLDDKVEVRLAEINDIAEKEFDLVVANINKHILLEIAGEIRNKIKKTGVLILSGLLITDETEIRDKYSSHGFKLIEKAEMGEWISLIFQS